MMSKLAIGIVVALMLTTLGSAYMVRNAFTGEMNENGVFYVDGQEMHVVKDVAILVECTVGGAPLNSSFNITQEAAEHLGFPKP